MPGIVRDARRPPGWRAGGPPPLTPADRPEVWPGPGEDLCYLAGDWRILQRIDGHRWSLDDLMTAWLAAEVAADEPPTRIADLGCGIGTVLLLLAWRFAEARVVGVEAQAVSAALARRSIAWNGVEHRCEVRLGDLRDHDVVLERCGFDLVTGTPPYLPSGTATESTRSQCGPCRIEHRGGIEAYCDAAARLLHDGGRFITCAAAGQRRRVETAASAAGLTIARRVDVVPRAGKAPLLSVHAMRRNAAPAGTDAAIVGETLVVRDLNGERTERFRAIRQAMGMPP